MAGLTWRKNLQEAMNEITGGTRLLFLFFYRPDCEGSIETLSKTFEDERVVKHIERETAPLKFNIAEDAEIGKKYRVDWTPTVVIADENGMELERFVGYLPPEEFMAQLALSVGLADFHLDRIAAAEREFVQLVDEHPNSEFVPQAEYYRGAAIYKETGDLHPLSEICRRLMEKYPESVWTKKCSVWEQAAEATSEFVNYSGGGSLGSGAY